MRRMLGGVILILACLTTGQVTSQAADFPTAKLLPVALAVEAAQAAMAVCQKQNFHISVAVTDQAGLVRVLLRDEKAGPHTLDSSTKKAYTAASFGLPTAALMKIVLTHPDAASLADINERILILPGGFPIMVGTEVVGAIGVGGTPGNDTDEACAKAGLDAIADRLK
ncbi:MAG TPA: heme-binding protein [Candidatus Baltobacteraceae bacterium]|nr:heme-binding protein [Candidatus Baltobacteraceae bacterium]